MCYSSYSTSCICLCKHSAIVIMSHTLLSRLRGIPIGLKSRCIVCTCSHPTPDDFTWNIPYVTLQEHNNLHILTCIAYTHALSPPSPCKLTEYQSGTQIASQFPTHGPPLCPLLSPLALLPPCGKGVLKVGGTLFISLKFLKCWCIYYYIQPRCDEVPSVSALVLRCREYTYVHVMARRIALSVEGVELGL